MLLVLLFLLLLWLTGCGGIDRFADTLNKRQVASCMELQVTVLDVLHTGSGSGMGHVYVATGGADLATCVQALRESRPVVVVPGAGTP